jgi:hypothetical protein
MTLNEINDLKKRYNALRKRGMKKYAKALKLAEKCCELEDEIRDSGGDLRPSVPAIFGAAFNIDPDAD